MPRLIVDVASIVALVSFIVGMIDSGQPETAVPIVGSATPFGRSGA